MNKYLGEGCKSLARVFAEAKFDGAVDKGGNDYIFHCDKVAGKVEHLGDDYYVVGMLHDVFEDCYENGKFAEFERDLVDAGIVRSVYNVPVIHALRALSKEKGEEYFDYLKRVAGDDMALDVKLADLFDNMDIERIPPEVRIPADYERVGKYKMAVRFLRAIKDGDIGLNEEVY